MRSGLLSFGLLILAAAAAQAQGSGDSVKALAGSWEVSNADRDRMCTVTLRMENVRGGYRLATDEACAVAIPSLREAESWTVSNDTVRFNDARGKTVFEFVEVESGMFEAERAGEGLYFLQNVAAAGPAFHTSEQVAGEWALMQTSGRQLCAFTLTTRAVPGNDEGALVLQTKAGCDTAAMQFVPASWRMDRGELVLMSSAGQNWRFALEDRQGNVWWRVPNRARGLSLVRR